MGRSLPFIQSSLHKVSFPICRIQHLLTEMGLDFLVLLHTGMYLICWYCAALLFGVPVVITSFLCNMFHNQMSRLAWNGMYSAMFRVSNAVKQGSVASPVMFCIYIDELLLKLAYSGVGYWFGKFYVRVTAYADGVVLLAPVLCEHCCLLVISLYFSIVWIVMLVSKSVYCFLLRGKRKCCTCEPVFPVLLFLFVDKFRC